MSQSRIEIVDNNIFMGGGFFGSRQLPVVGPALGQLRTGYSWNQFSRPMNQSVSRMAPRGLVRPGPVSRATRPTSQPISAGESEVGCYFCTNLGGAPTYWMSGAQADQWNQDRNAGCEKVSDKECQRKYSQMQANQQAAIRRTGFNAFNLPGATNVAPSAFNNFSSPTTYASSLSGRIRVENPELIG